MYRINDGYQYLAYIILDKKKKKNINYMVSENKYKFVYSRITVSRITVELQ